MGAVAASFLLCLLVLLIGEAFCRIFLDINFRRTSREFVVTDGNGLVTANAPNAAGVSFGTNVYSDQNGFRINPNRVEKKKPDAVLFLGDSVTFGVGVPEEKTFVGMFRQNAPDVTVYNAAVVGFSIPDYRRVINNFLPQHPEIKTVYLFYCLNDFHAATDTAQNNDTQDFERSVKLKAATVFSQINEYFGSHSKLYVFITGKLIDPSKKFFETDYNLYNVDEQKFDAVMQPILEINQKLRERNIEFVVFLNPYETQIRTGAESDLMPQRKLEQYFTQNSIRFVETTDDFKKFPSSTEFLFADPMHLSEKGHQIVYDALWRDWEQQTQHQK